MGRAPCCDKSNVKKGPWSPEEDAKLKMYIEKFGTGGNWIALPQKAGLRRCGKSCRLRWLNYLRPNIKHGEFSDEEDRVICTLFANIGSRWSIIAAQLPGRTDNDIKNYWNTKLKKKLLGIANPQNKKTQQASTPCHAISPQTTSSTSPFQASMPSSTLQYQYYYCPKTDFNSISTIPLTGITDPLSRLGDSSTNTLSSHQVLGQMSTMQNCFVIGGAEPSCSSSDGSCSNQVNDQGSPTNGDQKQNMMRKQSYFYHGQEGNQDMMLPNDDPGFGFAENHCLDHGFLLDSELEQEIKGTVGLVDEKPMISEEVFYELEMISRTNQDYDIDCFVESKTEVDRF
ncbi:hypothetical protein Droror1_Dr00008791 [Drosera rotundifolia]